jgi:hypothetical protein
MPATYACTTLEGVDVECTHCGVRMTGHTGSGSIRYFHCPSCQRWASSMYTDVFRADSKMRPRAPGTQTQASYAQVKSRLTQWLETLSSSDPYAFLGASRTDSEVTLREKYRELARKFHPDRGGDATQMRRLNEAYEAILQHRAQVRAGSARLVPALPQGL